MGEHDISILFGVASFHGKDPAPLAQALSYLHHNHLAPADLRVTAVAGGRARMDILPVEKIDKIEAMRQIPALIKAYIRTGGFVGEGAYIDHQFNTVDVCLLMDTARMVKRYHSFYTRQRGGYLALSYLHHNHLAPADLRVTAVAGGRARMDILPVEKIDKIEAMRQIPALIKAYIRTGGFVGEGAYIDHQFNTVDVCLLMDTARMVKRYHSFYTRQRGGSVDRVLG